MSNPHCQIIAADKIPGPQLPSHRILPWLWSGDEAYLTSLFHLSDGQSTLAERVDDPASLYHHKSVTVAIVNDIPQGGFLLWPGHQLSRRREADLVDLFVRTPAHARQHQRAILRELTALQGPVDRRDAYLAALGVAASVADPAPVYRSLVDAAIEVATDAHLDYLRVDLDIDHPALNTLRRRFGFRVFDHRTSTALAMERLHLHRPI